MCIRDSVSPARTRARVRHRSHRHAVRTPQQGRTLDGADARAREGRSRRARDRVAAQLTAGPDHLRALVPGDDEVRARVVREPVAGPEPAVVGSCRALPDGEAPRRTRRARLLSLIHISEPTRLLSISY